ncbi:ABC transporter substrate-binding protein [Microvirga alba]|uniref:Extracellular solute-binding protein n=1 Tax=Microvirga alba TaxID=2791025 RepID=A0A931BS70_9HYPH|nr:extracellular solute-binding protein [Microvirga alba]MBF9233834.1 extracellular solute-binding protein [Microvirga alba]
MSLVGNLRSLAVVATALASLAGPAHAFDANLVNEATKEGEVVWYTSLIQNQAARPVAAAFERRFPGIKVQIVAGTVGDLTVKMLNEGRAGQTKADVSHGGSGLGAMLNAGLIDRYVADAARDYPNAYKDPQGLWTAQVVSFLVPAVNTSVVAEKDIPASYQDLLAARWNGKIAWPGVQGQGGPVGLIGALLSAMGEDAGMQFLKKLSGQSIVNVPANNRVVLDQVIAGEYPIALATFSHHSELSAAQGAPVKWLKFAPALGTLDTSYILKNAPHPKAARLFTEFLLSSEGQGVLSEASYIPASPSVAAKIPGLKPETGGFKAVVITPELFMANEKKWQELYATLFK